MPEFFVPFAGKDIEEQTYEAFAKFIGAPLDGPRIYALSWRHNARDMQCRVGEKMPAYYRPDDEVVLAIFDCGNYYAICTPSRGGARGDPILAGKDHMTHATLFDR